MKKLLCALFAVAAIVALTHRADAIQATLATKQITVNISVTPSPVVYVPTTSNGRTIAVGRTLIAPQVFDSMVAYEPESLGDMVAVAPTQGPVKVDFTVKVDPTYAYFHLTPVNTNLNAGYGPNTFTCVYKVYGSYPRAWQITDYAFGSSSAGNTSGLSGFPLYNYPTASALDWLAEGVTSSYVAFANDGAPGQSTFTGTAGSTRNVCIDLSVNVPANVSAGVYSATISYRMVHS